LLLLLGIQRRCKKTQKNQMSDHLIFIKTISELAFKNLIENIKICS